MFKKVLLACGILLVSIALLTACNPVTTTVTQTSTTTTPTVTTTTNTSTTITTTTSPSVYTVTELKYILLSYYPDYFWCDPDFYPVARTGQEQQNAIDLFPTIQTNQEDFFAILTHLNLPVHDTYTDEQKLLIYREYKKLTYVINFTQAGSVNNYSLRIRQNQGYLVTGTISSSGTIIETSRTVNFNT